MTNFLQSKNIFLIDCNVYSFFKSLIKNTWKTNTRVFATFCILYVTQTCHLRLWHLTHYFLKICAWTHLVIFWNPLKITTLQNLGVSILLKHKLTQTRFRVLVNSNILYWILLLVICNCYECYKLLKPW